MTDIITSKFPKHFNCYVEAFGGGASVLLSRPHECMEVYNDLGQNVYSLFKCLSDDKLFEEFLKKASVTPYSRELNAEYKKDLERDDLSILDRGYKFFYVNNTSFNGVGGFSTGVQERMNVSKFLSRYLGKIDGLERWHKRLMQVVIENRDAMELFDIYDSKETFFYCFDKNTEVLTLDGWKNVGDCTTEDFCLSREPNTGKLEYVKVIDTISYRYKGNMYEYNGKNVDFCVTPNHRMFVYNTKSGKEEFITAEELYRNSTSKRYRLCSSGSKWIGDNNDKIVIDGFTYDKKDFAYLLGLFLTDGGVNNQNAVTIVQSKPHIKRKLIKVLDKLGIEYSYYNNGNIFYIHSKHANYFLQLGKKEFIRIPLDVKNWGVEYLNSLLEGIIDGDSDNEKRRIYIGCSKTLRDDIQEICYKIGLSSCWKSEFAKDKYLASENRIIHGNRECYTVSVNHKPHLMATKQNFNVFEYDDVVNCVTLEKWHTVLVRRNGKPIWCGQCDPPYVHDTRISPDMYEHEMTDNQHVKFVEKCMSLKGKVLISGYNHPIYDVLIENGWHRYDFPAPHDERHTESLWYNYDIPNNRLF